FFLSGRRLKRAIKYAVLADTAIRVSGYPAWLVSECHSVVGDMSETLALLLPSANAQSRTGVPWPSPAFETRTMQPATPAPDPSTATGVPWCSPAFEASATRPGPPASNLPTPDLSTAPPPSDITSPPPGDPLPLHTLVERYILPLAHLS